ncbi:MAG: SPOR domain-containing protein [Algoriphagus sp.]|uniref:SPOR domain-containing protein n=1 Tax=Algoriphagus sp. TaxID=1872435 RepID=UPI00181034FC|nr:SPOR domain-containing protein [Algoriphagus sp.]NVJ86077.1 SPOR domain-containing protein [Algoriphagus sp.]
MEKKQSKSWTDPKDFGLPYVEIKTLKEQEEVQRQEPVENPEVSSDSPLEASELRKKIKAQIPAKPVESNAIVEEETVPEAIAESNSSQDQRSKEPVSKPAEPVIEKKNPSSWIVYVVIIAILLVSAVVWQLMKDEPKPQATPIASVETEEKESTPIIEEVEEEPEINTENSSAETAENQDSVANIPQVQNPTVPTTETGTTIDRNEANSLIRIDSKEERARYFIVVGSLPSERLAIRKSADYRDRVSELYLILPYEDSPNYRLAIGRFNSFSQANQALSEIKDDYSEALWILKY